MILLKKYSSRDLFFVTDFDEISHFLGLGSEMGLNDRVILDI
jgi:hypothetical protein